MCPFVKEKGRVMTRKLYVFILLLFSMPAFAEFPVMTPEASVLDGPGSAEIRMFVPCPEDMDPDMDVPMPKVCGVVQDGKKQDLTDSLEEIEVDGEFVYVLKYDCKQAGSYVFYYEPSLYWHPDKEKMIRHYTKTVITSGKGAGWDAEAGTALEIKPVTDPDTLKAGSKFKGVVLKDGKPLKGADVKTQSLTDSKNFRMATKVATTNSDGEFEFKLVKTGWLAVGAVTIADDMTDSPDGDPVELELGSVLWLEVGDK